MTVTKQKQQPYNEVVTNHHHAYLIKQKCNANNSSSKSTAAGGGGGGSNCNDDDNNIKNRLINFEDSGSESDEVHDTVEDQVVEKSIIPYCSNNNSSNSSSLNNGLNNNNNSVSLVNPKSSSSSSSTCTSLVSLLNTKPLCESIVNSVRLEDLSNHTSHYDNEHNNNHHQLTSSHHVQQQPHHLAIINNNHDDNDGQQQQQESGALLLESSNNEELTSMMQQQQQLLLVNDVTMEVDDEDDGRGGGDDDEYDDDDEEEEDILTMDPTDSSLSSSEENNSNNSQISNNENDTNDPHQHHPAKLFCTEHIGNVLMDEFDGTTVLCRVCGDKASGFHYGVHSCEGCKGFFRRSIQQKIQYRPCTKNQQCSILRVNRNRCQYCRLKKCIAVGMSRDAVRFGRVPKREKAKILAAMQQSHHAKVSERALSAELEDTSKLTSAVVRAHMETCEFTKDKVQKCYNNALIKKEEQQQQNPNGGNNKERSRSTEITLACPLNPHPQSTTEDFSQRFSPAIRGVVEFAKRLPGFSILSQDDQVTLLKAGVFEILLVRLACMFKGNTMLCINGELLERETISAHQNARFLLDSMFKFAEQFNKLGLSDEQIGLFCALVVMAPDRPGLRNVELVTRLQSHLRSALHSLIPAYVVQELDRKIPDLRTLNTLHSEKLLAFKMEEQAFEQAQAAQQQQQQQQQQQSPIEQSNPPPSSQYDHQTNNSSTTTTSSSNLHDAPTPTTVSISPRRLSNNSSNGSTCPYKSFPRGLESPSGDSGIESGACSSPARSEDMVDEKVEHMPVLKRALQAPPIVDTNVLMNEAYRVHKKFRYSISDKQQHPSTTPTPPAQASTAPPTPNHHHHSNSHHYTQTPPPSSASSAYSSSTPPPPYSPSISPYRPQSTSSTSLSPPPPPPHQLYPQLASALTTPRSSNSSSSSSSSSNSSYDSIHHHHHHHHHHHNNNPHQFKSPLQLQHSTLAMKLNEKPKHMTEDQQVTSELLHSIIMRGGGTDDDDEIVDQSGASAVPLNLSKKLVC